MADITNNYGLTFPEATDSVNVHNDIKKLADDVDDALQSLDASNVRVSVLNNSGSTISSARPVYATGYSNGKTTISLFTSSLSDDKPILGLTKTSLNNNESGEVVVAGVLTNVNTSGFSIGDLLYVDASGALTTTAIGGAIGVVAVANPSTGIIVIQSKGNGTWGALKKGLS